MPKHYAINENLQHYTVTFNNTKTVSITFDKAFDKKPIVQVTPNDSGAFPLYKTNVTPTGASIRCKAKWTGDVDISVIER